MTNQNFHSPLVADYMEEKTPWCSISALILFSCSLSGVLYFVSSTVNPILYNLMSKKYRQATKDTLCRCCFGASRSSRSPEHLSVYYSYPQRRTETTSMGRKDNNRFHRSPIIRKHSQEPSKNFSAENAHLVSNHRRIESQLNRDSTCNEDLTDRKLLYAAYMHPNGYTNSVQF